MPSAFAERVVQRYATTGLWLLINAGTNGIGPHQVHDPGEPEPEPERVPDELPIVADESISLGTTARSLRIATPADFDARRRVTRVEKKPRQRAGLRARQCPICLSPMYPSHRCSIQPYGETWTSATLGGLDSEPTSPPTAPHLPVKHMWHERSLELDPAHPLSKRSKVLGQESTKNYH